MARPPTLAAVRALQAESLGYLLLRAGQIWGDRAIAAVNAEAEERGLAQPPLREAHTRLLPHLGAPEGIRITELARVVGVTKQAVQPLVAELAEVGIVRVELDPADARARRVYLTDFGVAALAHGTGILRRIEAELRPHLGARDTEALKHLLGKLLAALEAPVSGRSPPAAAPPPSGRRRGSPQRRR